ncbi:MAG: MipA/OmpV family protein [Deferribacteraceae bacterium]|jgi:outer membrane protein|nr:MipA/OmpV family protein [Deferribacteraceae bacterium]
MKYLAATFIAILSLCTYPAQAWDLSLGAGAYVEKSPYNGVGWETIPMPVIQFDSQYVFFEIQAGGIYLHKGENSVFVLFAEYMPLSYDAERSDHAAMDYITDRDATIMAGARYSAWGRFGLVKFEYLYDVFGESDGSRARLAYGLYFPVAGLDILPEIGVLWHSECYNDYYFGISGAEAAASGYVAFEGEDSFTPYATLALQYKFTEHFKMLTSITYSDLPDEVVDSPLTGVDYGFSVMAGLAYIF